MPIEIAPSDDPFILARVPIPANLQADFLKEHTIEDAKLCIQAANEWIDSKVKAGEAVSHGKAYRTALQGNWRPNSTDIQQYKKKLESVKAAEIEEKKKKERAEAEKANQAKKVIENSIFAFESLSEIEQKDLIEKLCLGINNTEKTYLKKDGVRSPVVRVKFSKFFNERVL